MNILFVHQNFPGQYLHLARHFGATSGNNVVFITQRKEGAIAGVKKVVYAPKRKANPAVHHYIRETEGMVLNGQEVARTAIGLKEAGFVPDIMLGHNGWGEIWFLKEVFPNTPLLGYFEFFYRLRGADVGFDPTIPETFDTGPRVRTKNLGNLLGLDACDLGQCPTQWQKSLYPSRYRSMLHVIHEGIDTKTLTPNPKARLRLGEAGREFRAGEEIVTYVARNLEPYRGFPSFMRSLPEVLARRPKAQVLIVGGDDVSYGPRLPAGRTFRQDILTELGDRLDLDRVHFLGALPYAGFVKVLQVSRVHVYLTQPFVLSWSMLEAMSTGCLIVASKTQPVEEVLRHGENGLLVDFHDHAAIAERVIEALADPRAHASLRQNARETVLHNYDLHSICLPAHLRLLHSIANTPKRSRGSVIRR